MARNDLTRAEAEQRWASATPWQQRAPKANLVLHNDGSEAEFLDAVDEAAGELLHG